MHEILKKKLGKYLIDSAKLEENTPEDTALDPRFKNHVYIDPNEPDGQHYQSVTTVLSELGVHPNVVKWANSLGFRRINYDVELEKSARAGTALHLGCQGYIDPENCTEKARLDDPLMDYYMRKRLEQFRMRMELERPWKTIFTETTLFSKKYEIAGTIDWFVEFRGLPTIGDFKSSSGIREKHLYQLGGYGILFEENGIRFDRAMIILCKEDNCMIHYFDKEIIIYAMDAFLRAKEYAENHKSMEQKAGDRKLILPVPQIPTKA